MRHRPARPTSPPPPSPPPPSPAAEPAAEPAAATRLTGPADVDNRKGSMKPTAAQSSAAAKVGGRVRWNAYGTPAGLGPATLATGLAKDPVAAAKEYLARNTALFGLDAEAVDALTTVAVSPLGSGAVVLLQQTFGALPAGNDGLVAVAVSGGTVVRVTRSTSTRTTRSGRSSRPPRRRRTPPPARTPGSPGA